MWSGRLAKSVEDKPKKARAQGEKAGAGAQASEQARGRAGGRAGGRGPSAPSRAAFKQKTSPPKPSGPPGSLQTRPTALTPAPWVSPARRPARRPAGRPGLPPRSRLPWREGNAQPGRKKAGGKRTGEMMPSGTVGPGAPHKTCREAKGQVLPSVLYLLF
ncbi:E3 ubiquitin-protein ligase DTX1-like [Elephas maximus indicus]|uniref:E3 ubiquitin-protein ligase DTX1-like n=1 Tax=Elephas maximus indicus TaxID=99487 RepID=UPI002115F859|nr:E3 ubiquitin-protein ligase DTX1-like [Elephas maximus indicus]